MEIVPATQPATLSPLEKLLTFQPPALEHLVQHLSTSDKLALGQTSRYLRQLLFSYGRTFAHLDFRIGVLETSHFDSYTPGTVYNLDRLLLTLPVEGRIVSLTLDWTAVNGYFLFNNILDRCQNTLEHLSVRGCRKVSVKHHIVPYFVCRTSMQTLTGGPPATKPALKSLYVYKARGVRRKPFLIDRKPADGDEPSRYLTTLCAELGIWLDLALCPTQKLRCPRRKEILRRGKEKFCVPFDRRWRVAQGGDMGVGLSEVDDRARRKTEQAVWDGVTCWNCSSVIEDRCELCFKKMSCAACYRNLCENCAYQPVEDQAAVINAGMAAQGAEPEDLRHCVPSDLLIPCCTRAGESSINILCQDCFRALPREHCSLCNKGICIDHEKPICKTCSGGCGRVFCYTVPGSAEKGCGEERADLLQCQTCSSQVCGICRAEAAASQPANPVRLPPRPRVEIDILNDEDDASSTASGDQNPEGVDLQQLRTWCDCKTCQQFYFCPTCFPEKPTSCITTPEAILEKRAALDATVDLYKLRSTDPNCPDRWYTRRAVFELHPDAAENLFAEFSAHEDLRGLNFQNHSLNDKSPYPGPDDIISDAELRTLDVQVADDEKILERVTAVRLPLTDDGPREVLTSSAVPYPDITWVATTHPPGETMVLCKWLGKDEHVTSSWEKRSEMVCERSQRLVDDFIRRVRAEQAANGGGVAYLQQAPLDEGVMNML